MSDDIDLNLPIVRLYIIELVSLGNPQSQILSALRDCGVTFGEHTHDTQILLNRLDNSNRFVHIWHPMIQDDASTEVNRRSGIVLDPLWKSARCVYGNNSRSLLITQSGSWGDQGISGVDRMFTGLLGFAESLLNYLPCEFGFIDDLGSPNFTDDDIERFHLPAICWVNYFGPKFVQWLGRGFLLDTPAHRVEELSNGGILVQATESFMAWRYDPYFGEGYPYEYEARHQHPLAKHFHRYYPDLLIYRGEPDLS